MANKPLPNQLSEWVNTEDFQQMVVDTLAFAKKQGATEAKVGLSISCGLQMNVRQQSVDTLEFNRDKGLSITVYVDKQKGSASTSDLKPRAIEETVKAAVSIAKATQADSCYGLAAKELMAQDIKECDLYHPWDISVEEAIQIATECERAALEHDPRIINSDGASFHSSQGFYVQGNSQGFIASTPSSRHSLSCVVIAKDDGGMERDHEYTLSRESGKLLSAQMVGEVAASKAVSRLSAQKCHTQECRVLFDKSVASSIFGHFLSAISGSKLYRDASFLKDSIDTQVFPTWLRIDERPHLLKALGSSSFDGDGLATYAKDFVTDGRVRHYVLSTYSARRLGLASTANAGGVHNIYVSPNDAGFDAMLKRLDTGVLVTRMMGQGINLVTGDYSRGASGFWVENGEIQYPISEFTVAGNLKEIFANIEAVGDDTDPRQSMQVGSTLISKMMVAGS